MPCISKLEPVREKDEAYSEATIEEQEHVVMLSHTTKKERRGHAPHDLNTITPMGYLCHKCIAGVFLPFTSIHFTLIDKFYS